ncbi:MAG: hypothetical protein ABIF71_12220 [Planctomycetota bacterium]
MFLPPEARRANIQFYCAKSLPYGVRFAAAIILLAGGFALEAWLREYFWFGLPVLFAGILLLLVKGYKNVEELGDPGDWRTARREEVTRIIELNRDQKTWDAATVDITNKRGGCVFLILAALTVITAMAAVEITGMAYMGPLVVVNALVMIPPFWVTGVRFILTNDRLVVKADALLAIEKLFQPHPDGGEEFQFQLRTAPAKGKKGVVPADVKAMVAFKSGPPDFLGLQMQVSINSVQGSDFPYYYCVLVARRPLAEWGVPAGQPDAGIILENQTEKDIHILIIRQYTTKTSGYHTTADTQAEIFAFALEQARKIAG